MCGNKICYRPNWLCLNKFFLEHILFGPTIVLILKVLVLHVANVSMKVSNLNYLIVSIRLSVSLIVQIHFTKLIGLLDNQIYSPESIKFRLSDCEYKAVCISNCTNPFYKACWVA